MCSQFVNLFRERVVGKVWATDTEIEDVNADVQSIVESVEEPTGVTDLGRGEYSKNVKLYVRCKAWTGGMMTGNDARNETTMTNMIKRGVLASPVCLRRDVGEVLMIGKKACVEHRNGHILSCEAALP